MREMMSKFKELVRHRPHENKQGKHAGESGRIQRTEADWEMSSDDALRAPIVSGYK